MTSSQDQARARVTAAEADLNALDAGAEQLRQALAAARSLLDARNRLAAYYGSEHWFADRRAHDAGELTDPATGVNIPAGVLSEDAAYNTLDDWRQLADDMAHIAARIRES